MQRNSLQSANLSNVNNTSHKDYESSIGFRSTLNDNEGTSLMKPHTFDNLKVVIRVRPALPREMEVDLPFRSIVHLNNLGPSNKRQQILQLSGVPRGGAKRARAAA